MKIYNILEMTMVRFDEDIVTGSGPFPSEEDFVEG